MKLSEEKKAKLQKIGKWTLVVLVIGYIAYAVTHFSAQKHKSVCLGVDIVIEDSDETLFLNKGDIQQYMIEHDIKPSGKNLDSTNKAKIENGLLKTFDAIKEVEVYQNTHDRLVISIWQKKPILRIMQGAYSYYIDEDGKKMKTGNNPAYVPIATGCIPDSLATGELWEFAKFLQDDKFWGAQIEQIDIDALQNATLIPRVGNQKIEIGQLKDYDEKLNKLMTLYTDAFSLCGWNQYKKINLEYNQQVVCTRK